MNLGNTQLISFNFFSPKVYYVLLIDESCKSSNQVVSFKVWFFYRKYFNDHPESMAEAQTAGIALTFTYLVSVFSVEPGPDPTEKRPTTQPALFTTFKGLISVRIRMSFKYPIGACGCVCVCVRVCVFVATTTWVCE